MSPFAFSRLPTLCVLALLAGHVPPADAQDDAAGAGTGTEGAPTVSMAGIEQAWARGDYVFAREGLQVLAEQTGTALAQYRYGRILLEGRGGPRDVTGAVAWLEKAVAQNHLEAATLLARILLSETPPQTARAQGLLQGAAARGDAEAQVVLAGLLADSDPEAAFAWWLAAAEQGKPAAQFALSRAYGAGRGTAPNEAEALRWLTEAAGLGHTEAQFYLAVAHERGQGLPARPAEALRWYRRAAEAGLPIAQRELGTRYLTGAGTEPDAAEAQRWLEAAAEAGDPGAMFNLGQAHFTGALLAQDDARAYAWFERAAAEDLPRAQAAQAAMLEAGRGTAADPDAALVLYRRAAEAGHGPARIRLGRLAIAGGLDGKLAPHRAVPWVVAAYRNGEPGALDWLRTQAEQGMRSAQANLGALLLDSAGETAGDGAGPVAEAVDWLTRAARAGEPGAQALLGEAHATGAYGLPLDYVAAHTWLNLAAASGDDAAAETRALISELMTPEQVAEAQAAARAHFAAQTPPPLAGAATDR